MTTTLVSFARDINVIIITFNKTMLVLPVIVVVVPKYDFYQVTISYKYRKILFKLNNKKLVTNCDYIRDKYKFQTQERKKSLNLCQQYY